MQYVIYAICYCLVLYRVKVASWVKVSVGIESKPALFFYGDVNVKRNTMHTYTFNLEPPDEADSGVKAVFSDGGMANETMELID